jgi:hypothetical protein
MRAAREGTTAVLTHARRGADVRLEPGVASARRAVDAHDVVHDMMIAPRKKGDVRREQCGWLAA